MGNSFIISFFMFSLLFLADNLSSHPLCIDSSYPINLKNPLKFCPYNVTSCCNSTQDMQLQKQFQSMNISDPSCASIVKSILCAKCDQFSAELFRVNTVPRPLPVLCNSTLSSTSLQSDQAANNFCSTVWDTCMNVSVLNSPFEPSLKRQSGSSVNSNLTKITEMWQSKTDFCTALGEGSSDGSLCFGGEPVSLNSTGEAPSSPSGLCLEKIGNGSYLSMVPYPDGSNRAFFSNQQGQIWLAALPREGSGGVIELDESKPLLDLSDIVHVDGEFGLMGIAIHPRFSENGRLFASFNCDKTDWAGCEGRCACNSDVNCDPSKLPLDNGAQPCQYQSVISEFSVSGTKSQSSMPISASPEEVRRIFTMGLPFTSHHGGQILFGPDGYLYFMMGDGGGTGGDPYNFAQNKRSLLGKIMRFDVNNFPSNAVISTENLWGNYSIPKDNPYINDHQSQGELWAIGLRNPWRCSFDAERPSYFMCADVGQDIFEEVNIITKGGNFGWRVYEGIYPFTPQTSPGGNTSMNSINPIFPVMGYNHSAVKSKEGSASITGGYFYRSKTDPCMYGRYLYADLYGGAIWEGTEFPEDSGNFTSSLLSFSCAEDSPIKCSVDPGSSRPVLGYVFSFAEDLNKDVYVLTSSGVYRVVRPSHCKYSCSKETVSDGSEPISAPSSSPESQATQLGRHLCMSLVILLSSLVLFMIDWLDV